MTYKKALLQEIKSLNSDEYMSQEQIESFRTFLRAELAEINGIELNAIKELGDEETKCADEITLASNNADRAIRTIRASDLANKKKQINNAFIAMRNDEFGYCQKCGAEIGMERMLINPATTLDADCATLEEIKEKQRFNKR